MRNFFILLLVVTTLACLFSFGDSAREEHPGPRRRHGNRGREVRLHNRRRETEEEEDIRDHHDRNRRRHRNRGLNRRPVYDHDYDTHERHDPHVNLDLDTHETHDRETDEQDSNSHENEQRQQIFTFQVGNDFGPFEYIDIDGTLKGFYIDLIKAVCEKAERKCEVVFDSPENCWTSTGNGSVEKPGYGLMAGFYDGCMGYSQSPERLNSFAFSEPFVPNYEAHLYGTSEYYKCDPLDITQLKIGFISGWSMNRNCLSRQWEVKGNSADEEDGYISYYHQDNQDLLSNLLSGNTDAVFSVPEYVPQHMNLKPLCDKSFSCTRAGLSLMTRKDSRVLPWWNTAFKSLQESGEFEKLCDESNEQHSFRGHIDCI